MVVGTNGQVSQPGVRGGNATDEVFRPRQQEGKRAFVLPKVNKRNKEIAWEIQYGDNPVPEGTVKRTGAQCIFCDGTVDLQYVRDEGKAGRITFTMIAAVAEGNRRRIYLPPEPDQLEAALRAEPEWAPETELPPQALDFGCSSMV